MLTQRMAYAKPIDIITSPRENIWSEIGDRINLKSYPYDDDAVRKQIRWYMAHQDALYELTENAQPYIYYVTEQVKKQNMPIELALLPMVESDYKPNGRSGASATGLWQLMPTTARHLGLHVNGWYDGRKDIVASTNAALSYLQYLHHYFNNWPLAFAAYNAGIGKVIKAIHHNRAHHRPIDYWSLPLPQETKVYLPKLLAIATILANPDLYKLPIHHVENNPYFGPVKIETPLTLTTIAELANTDIKTLQTLNPGVMQAEISPGHNYNVLVPIHKTKSFTTNLAQHVQTAKTKPSINIVYRVKGGDSLSKIAYRYQVSVAKLRRYNRLTSNIIKIGQSISIPKSKEA